MKHVSYRSAAIAALVLPLFVAMSVSAQASAVCDRLNTRLSNLPKIVTSNANARDYTAAISRQNLDLRKARNERRRLGCSSGSIIIVGGPNADACDSMEATIGQMENDLDTLKARRQHLVSGGDNDINRRRILAALDVNRCSEQQDDVINASASEPEIHRNILEGLPKAGETFTMLRGSTDIDDLGVPSLDGGPLRTMCVRTCDGAFFPISGNATPADFQRDSVACERRCPGAETELYFHSLATEETDEMVSAVTGQPYTHLPTAFAYRTRDHGQTAGQCGCKPAAVSGFGVEQPVIAKQSLPADGSSIIAVTTPSGKEKAAAVVEDRPYDPSNAKVRVVGPTFLPPQESAIDLKHPTGPGYQPVQSN
ncbi:DUF2865 domain-containing protein [Rhizobium sp. 32-5/1]|uniref:DUF2865 domain-containing protein n=1 Tax=Rhizobium sp. 32-5/1 TaxID=3019602 RepID=UPI00240DECDA|nr:DUF2865 domain-containing protein [Rhizobium sp. 32-5/1]WEZ85173.1 DUF2865 domain-containing protein [Rhizobium sp. 32-5/1]